MLTTSINHDLSCLFCMTWLQHKYYTFSNEVQMKPKASEAIFLVRGLWKPKNFANLKKQKQKLRLQKNKGFKDLRFAKKKSFKLLSLLSFSWWECVSWCFMWYFTTPRDRDFDTFQVTSASQPSEDHSPLERQKPGHSLWILTMKCIEIIEKCVLKSLFWLDLIRFA